jgi:putative transposase
MTDNRFRNSASSRISEVGNDSVSCERWFVDHSKLDILIADEVDGRQVPTEVWGTIVIKDPPRPVREFLISKVKPNLKTIALCIISAAIAKGENESGFKKSNHEIRLDRDIGNMPADVEALFSTLGVRINYPPPGKPRGKGAIECYFQTLNRELLSKLPGHISTTGENRGADDDNNVGDLLTLPQLQEQVHQWVAKRKLI